MEHDSAQRRTSAVSEALLDASENTSIGGLGRHANDSCEGQSEEVKRIGQHGGGKQLVGLSGVRCLAFYLLLGLDSNMDR